MRRFWMGALACGLSLALGSPLFAQRTTGGINGTVKDSTGAVLPGVAVTISGENIVGVQSTTTNESGYYRIINLPPGDYELKFSIAGFKTEVRRGLRVGVGAIIEGNASLEVSQLQEQIDVVAETPVVDTSSNEVGSNLDREWVENAPQRRFSFFDLVAHAPGSLQAADGSRRTLVYGSSYDENSFQLDGVDITDNFFNEAFVQPNSDAIEEIEVLSLGAPAEYGNLTGAVYNIVTRQGSNEFHGDLNFFFQTDGLTSNNLEDVRWPDDTFVNACGDNRCPWTREAFRDFTAQIGGPIVKDKLWFFGSYQYQLDNYSAVGVDGSVPNAPVKDRADRYLFKLNWQINPKHKIVANVEYDDKVTDNGLAFNEAPSTAWTRFGKTPTPGVAYTGVLSNKTVVDVRYSGFYGDVSGGPTDPNQPRDLPRFYDIDTGQISGGHYYWYEVTQNRTTATAKVSHLADDFLGGSHDFRFGVQYSEAVAAGNYGYNDFVYTYSLYYPGYGYGTDRQPFSYSGNSRTIGVFLDDTFRVTDRLSVNIGARYDHNKAYSSEQQELDEFGQPTGTTFPKTDFFTWKYFSPRVGFNLKLTPDGKTILKGHVGRYHRSVATGEYANIIGPNVKPYFAGPYDTVARQFLSLSQVSSNEQLSVSPDYESPYTDQFTVSLERELFRNVGVNLNYVHKRGRKFGAWRDTTGVYAPITFVDDFEAGGATGRTITISQLQTDAEDRLFEIANPDGMETDIHAVSFGLLKRMANKWQLNASATWLRATGRLSGSNFGVSLQQRGGLQFRTFGRNPNDFVNSDGRLRGDVGWQLKLQLLYQLPAGFLVSANVNHHDNAHLARIRRVPSSITNIPAPASDVMLQLRGENGRLPAITFVDMRLQKDFDLGSQVKMSVFADALNLLNEDAAQSVLSSRVTSSVFNYHTSFVDPRRFMLGAKLKF